MLHSQKGLKLLLSGVTDYTIIDRVYTSEFEFPKWGIWDT